MPHYGPVSRADLIRALRRAGFEGPFPGGSHQFMRKAPLRVPIPNPHRADISVNLLRRILEQAGISREEWEQL